MSTTSKPQWPTTSGIHDNRTEMTDEEALNAVLPEEPQPLSEKPATDKDFRSFAFIVKDDGNVSINFHDDFKVYEFYGALLTVLIEMWNKPVMTMLKNMQTGPDQSAIKKQLEGLMKALG